MQGHCYRKVPHAVPVAEEQTDSECVSVYFRQSCKDEADVQKEGNGDIHMVVCALGIVPVGINIR